ncbi:MAG TPA: CHAD domain-containing protein [Cyclobacteriaceae bacterium]
MKSVAHFYNKRIRNIACILDLRSGDFTDETVHKLRVEIKKIKAVFKLASEIKGKFNDKKYLKPFADLFRTAGNLRALQMDRKLIPASGGYTDALKYQETKARNDLLETIQSQRIEFPPRQKKLINILKSISEKDIRKQLVRDTVALRNVFKTRTSKEDQLHAVRKKLKGFYLLTKKSWPKKTAEELSAFIDLLGKWHDRREAFLHLMKFEFTSKVARDLIKNRFHYIVGV